MPKQKYNKLTKEEKEVIESKGTEAPFSGKYYNFHEDGTYTCKKCGAPLYKSKDKFDAHCGWPSFDDAIPGAIKESPDPDGLRTEITCAKCGAHLGHIFRGERLTKKDVRHCVNSISLEFSPKETDKIQKAYFAGGCFWGMEYYFQNEEGVIATRVGYMGGEAKNPSYEEVSGGKTGHAETLEITFDTQKTDFETLAKLFFEIHDPGQKNRQGPDVGKQYRSAIFYTNDKQKKTAESLIKILKEKGHKVKTELKKAGQFYEAEEYHQKYYEKNGGEPYCHVRIKKF